MKEPSDGLRMRWKSGIWNKALTAILLEAERATRIISADFLKSLGLPIFEGRLDLRGIPFYEVLDPPIGGHDRFHIQLAGAEYKDLDFSYADVNAYAGDTRITNCLFIQSTLTNFRNWNCVFMQCDFSRAFMPWFSATKGSRFIQSVFDDTKIRHHAEIAGYTHFLDCSFLNLDWRMINFRRCVFENIVFSGHLQNAHADRSGGHGIDALRDFMLKVQNKGYNVFRNCSFTNLLVTRFSVENESLTLLNCTGFPCYFLPSTEFRSDKDFYSESCKPKPS